MIGYYAAPPRKPSLAPGAPNGEAEELWRALLGGLIAHPAAVPRALGQLKALDVAQPPGELTLVLDALRDVTADGPVTPERVAEALEKRFDPPSQALALAIELVEAFAAARDFLVVGATCER